MMPRFVLVLSACSVCCVLAVVRVCGPYIVDDVDHEICRTVDALDEIVLLHIETCVEQEIGVGSDRLTWVANLVTLATTQGSMHSVNNTPYQSCQHHIAHRMAYHASMWCDVMSCVVPRMP